MFWSEHAYIAVELFTYHMLRLLVALFNYFHLRRIEVSEDACRHGVNEDLGESLLVGASLHQVQLIVGVGIVPEDVTAGFEEHEVKLMGEARLCNGQDQAFLADLVILINLFFFFFTGPYLGLLLAQIESFNQELTAVLL